MGCDIHFYVEVLTCGHEDCRSDPEMARCCLAATPKLWKRWQERRRKKADESDFWKEYYRKPASQGNRDDLRSVARGELFFHTRSYQLFGRLAGVREHPYSKCVMPTRRGLPKGCAAAIKRDFKAWGENIHDVTWFSLPEILERDWEKLLNAPDREVMDWKALEDDRDGGWPDALKLLRQLAAEVGAPEMVRIVVGFDN